ncbi:MAG: porin [Methylotenera sp.]|nr:porin [Oligoflexia bacterium]
MIRLLLATSLLMAPLANAEEATHAKPVVSAFVDTYWAYSTAKPPTLDRQYTTQAVRHNEFNLNLAFIDAKIDADRYHGRLALQAGTSVQSNYSGEPTVGVNSGPSLSRNIQEAFAGYRISEGTWIDAGIMFSHIGLESFISRDNATYTRSLVSDFTPYYQSGARVTHQFGSRFSGQILLLNGWQNISETNPNKALGTQLAFQATPELSVIYNTFLGKEQGFRHFHDLILKNAIDPHWVLSAQADLGFQDTSPAGGSARWYGVVLISRHQISETGAIVLRAERYSDPKNVIVATPTQIPFRVWGASLGYDRALTPQLVWRSEARTLVADREVYLTRPSGAGKNETTLVSSLGLTF